MEKANTNSIPSTEKLLCFGAQLPMKIAGQTKNPFWKGIWNTLAEYLNKYNSNFLPENKESDPLWFNQSISRYELFLPNWWKRGILFVSDVINQNGDLMSKTEIETTYNFKTIFSEYIRVHKSVKKCKGAATKTTYGPIYPLNALAVGTHLKGTKKIRKVLTHVNKDLNESLSKKWDQKLNVVITGKDWSKIFKNCFNIIQDNNLIWFQYRTIFRILGTQ